jgi:hypothetical protein
MQQQIPNTPNPNKAPTQNVDQSLKYILPINRNGVAIAAGYVALFSFPILFLAPIALMLGIIAMVQLKKTPTKGGRGRALFAIIYGGIFTLALATIVITYLVKVLF